MENKKNITNCDRIEESLLNQILQENTPSCCSYENNKPNERFSYSRKETSNRCRCDNTNERVRASYNVNRDSCRGSQNESRRTNRCSENRPCNYNDSYYVSRREGSINNDNIGCDEKCVANSCINGYRPAMVYCPDHNFEDIYSCEESLERGTLFRILDLPFYPTKCNCNDHR